jgi:hypothetical protein
MMGRRRTVYALSLAFLAAGCGKTGKAGETAAPTDMTQGGTSSGGAPSTGGGPSTGGAPPLDCAGPRPGPAPLGRLGNFELNRSLEGLFHDLPSPVVPTKLVEDRHHDDPQSEVDMPAVSRWHGVVHDLAEKLHQSLADMQALTGSCKQPLDEPTCRDQFLEKFLRLAYRRAVTDEDRSEMTEVFAEGQKLGGDFESGERAVIEVALQNPDFMYLIEQGDGQTTGDSVELSGYESAARLAYFLTGSAPDEALLAAADQGALDPDALEAHARRLLGSAPNREVVRHFYARLLGLELLEADNQLGYTADIIAAAQEETARFVEDVTFDDGGTYGALLTSKATWVNGALASFYGYPGSFGSKFQKIELDPTKRMGILTQSAFLRATSPTTRTSPVHRGLRVLEQMLCYQMPPPPAGLVLPSVDPTPDSTTRQRLEMATSNAPCQSCHHEIDPVGFAFEHYDQLGVWRDTEHGLPIDSSAEIFRTDMQGTFADAIELVKRMADSNDAKACFVSHWLEAAYRRAAAPEDACARQALEQAFADAGDQVVELMVALTKTDNFRYRLKSELAP